MTRLAVLTDLHGNLPALEAIITDMAQHAPDAVVVCGDLINLAPYSTEVLTRVFDLGWAAIRGNHEFYLLDHNTPRQPANWHDYTTPRWLNATIPPALKRRVAALPDTLTLYYADAPPLRVIHGLPNTHWDGIYPSTPNEDMIHHLQAISETTVVCGHVHLRQERWIQDDNYTWHIINPGSAGLPLDGGASSAPYAILEGDAEGWHATYHRPAYDNAALLAAMDTPEYHAAHGAFARLYAAEFRAARARVWPFQNWRAACRAGIAVTDALVEEFLALGAGMGDWMTADFRA